MMMIMNGECYDDCNVAAKITAGKEHKCGCCIGIVSIVML